MKKIIIKLIEVLIIVIITPTIVFATSSTELKNQQNQINNEIKEKKEELEEVQEEKSATQKEVDNLNDKINSYQNEISDLESKEEKLNDSIKQNESKLTEIQKDFDKQQQLLNERLVSLYEAGDTTYLDVLLTSQDLTDLISNWFLVSELAAYDTDMLEKIENTKNEIENTKNELVANKSELQDAKASKEAKTAELKTAKQEKDKKVAELSEDEKEIQAQISELQEHERSVSKQIKSLAASYDSKKTSQSSTNTNTSASSYGFGWPVKSVSINTPYGQKGKAWSLGYHTGVDFKASDGTAIYSVGDGVVVDTGFNKAYGNFVEIYHGNNVYSFYAHATSVSVSKGTSVSKGQLIMYSGHTGNAYGPHLHFEIRTPGSGFSSCVNPMPYLP